MQFAHLEVFNELCISRRDIIRRRQERIGAIEILNASMMGFPCPPIIL